MPALKSAGSDNSMIPVGWSFEFSCVSWPMHCPDPMRSTRSTGTHLNLLAILEQGIHRRASFQRKMQVQFAASNDAGFWLTGYQDNSRFSTHSQPGEPGSARVPRFVWSTE